MHCCSKVNVLLLATQHYKRVPQAAWQPCMVMCSKCGVFSLLACCSADIMMLPFSILRCLLRCLVQRERAIAERKKQAEEKKVSCCTAPAAELGTCLLAVRALMHVCIGSWLLPVDQHTRGFDVFTHALLCC